MQLRYQKIFEYTIYTVHHYGTYKKGTTKTVWSCNQTAKHKLHGHSIHSKISTEKTKKKTEKKMGRLN